MIETIENTIIKNLISNEEYMRKVLPFLKPDYFDNTHEKIIFEEVTKFIVAYDKSPTSEILSIECEKRKDINDDTYKEIVTYLNDIEPTPTSEDWLIDTTEKWCKERAIYLALVESISIADGHDIKKGVDAIPAILSDALAVGSVSYTHLTLPTKRIV